MASPARPGGNVTGLTLLFVDEGGLMAYGPSRPDLYRRTAAYVDISTHAGRVNSDSGPSRPICPRPTKFEFVIDVKAARTLALAIPATVLVRADQPIE
ncbi:MAG TPA: hypothetical protein VFR64_01210 [Methylomirabilota bacterium]|nr:hypothetical protein [Methylomirabilota bacterium]